MKATELRIGNYVNSRKYNTVKVEAIMFDTIFMEGIDEPESLIDINPILLTEECLIKNNIPKTINWLWLDSEYCITLDFTNVCGQDTNGRYEIWVYFNGTLLKQVQYKHQLQNLYYTLTGKEI
jgi:hypothetical protein